MESVNNITSSASKNDILDPLSVIIKLYLYNSKPLGTKISVGNNKVDIQYSTYVQGIWRRYNGDSKNDINILVCPILYACVYYLTSGDPETRALYLPIFNEALQALSNLKQTYANTAIIYNIEHLINIIQSHINNEVSTGIVNTDTPLYKIKENIYQHLNEVWTPSRKNVLFGFIKEIAEVKNSTLKQRLLDGLAVFMDCIDTMVSNVLLNNKNV
jgi:hypothetical protein